MDEGGDEEAVFRKKPKRTVSLRSKQPRRENEEDEDEAGLEDRILGAKFEQKMRKRVKGLVVTEASGQEAQVSCF